MKKLKIRKPRSVIGGMVVGALAVVIIGFLVLVGGYAIRYIRYTATYADYGNIGIAGGMASSKSDFMSNDSYDIVESGSYDSDGDFESGEPEDKKLVKTASVRVETRQYQDYFLWLTQAIDQTGGYTENKECIVRDTGYDRASGLSMEYRLFYADLRIPADKLDAFLAQMNEQETGKVVYLSENVKDITVMYSDTEVHLESIRIEQERLQALMERAETVEEIISIEDRLSYVRYEIESYEKSILQYDRQVDYATVSLELKEVVDYSDPVREGFFARCWQGFQDNVTAVGFFLEDAAVYLFSHIPAFAVILITVSVCVALVKFRRRRKLLKKQEAKPDEIK